MTAEEIHVLHWLPDGRMMRMMYPSDYRKCLHCGAHRPTEYRFCPTCGGEPPDMLI